MTFSQTVKKEIIEKRIDNDCCVLARLAGLIKAMGSLSISRGTMSFSCENESEDVLKHLLDLIKIHYGYTLEEIKINSIAKGSYLFEEVEIPFDIGQDILLEIGAIERTGAGNLQINDGVENHLLKEDCCKKAFIAGLFLGCGTVSHPVLKNSGYHFEFELVSKFVAHDVMNLLADFDLSPRMVERKEKFVVYFKESDAIFDMLVFMGATKAGLSLQNLKIQRHVKNNINRQANCQTANAEKAVASAVKEIVAIQTIATTIGIDGLDPRLEKVALARLNYPELSLNDLLTKIEEPLTKSGLRYRLEKIIEIAKELNGG